MIKVGWSYYLALGQALRPMGRRIILYGVIFPPNYLQHRIANAKNVPKLSIRYYKMYGYHKMFHSDTEIHSPSTAEENLKKDKGEYFEEKLKSILISDHPVIVLRMKLENAASKNIAPNPSAPMLPEWFLIKIYIHLMFQPKPCLL